MGDIVTGKSPRCLTSHQCQLSLSIPSWVGTMSTGDGPPSPGKKRPVPCDSTYIPRSCDQDCWHTEFSRLKALAVNLSPCHETISPLGEINPPAGGRSVGLPCEKSPARRLFARYRSASGRWIYFSKRRYLVTRAQRDSGPCGKSPLPPRNVINRPLLTGGGAISQRRGYVMHERVSLHRIIKI